MKTIRIAFLIVLSVFSVGTAWADDNDAVKKDMALLQGDWTMSAGSADGNSMPAEIRKLMKRTCKNDEATVTMDGHIYFKAKITIDPSKKPKTIDYDVIDGLGQGEKRQGIYEVEGDSFKSSFGPAGAERPVDFTTKPGDGRTMSVWKREKAASTNK